MSGNVTRSRGEATPSPRVVRGTPRETHLSTSLWIALIILALCALALVMGLRYLQRRSREAWRRIDWNRIREWKDDEE